MSRVDIAIVGAGLVGVPLALTLARQGWSVALLDAGNAAATDRPAPATGLLQRCTALSLGTRQWFESCDLWSEVAVDACAIEQVHVSHKGYFGSTRLNAKELNADAVGYVVNNETFNAILLSQLQSSTIRYIPDARVSKVSYTDDSVSVHYADKTLNARLLVAADGVSSVVRESAGIGTRQVDYEQAAILGTVQLQGQHHNVAYERFTDSGPLALLPRPGQYMSVVDCLNPGEREQVSGLSDSHYLQRLQQRFGYRLGRFAAMGPRFATPLVRIEARQQIAQRTVLLGNAMRLLHPVGGQGYNLAMRDVAQLQELLVCDGNTDPGNASLLNRFVQLRQADQEVVVRFTDVLARGFRGKASLPAHARALGLVSLDTVAPLRQRFARRTMGLM